MAARPPEEPDKAGIRRIVRERVRALSPGLRRGADSRIAAHLAVEVSRQPPGCWVMGYVSMADEPRIDGALCGFVAEGRAVYLPRTVHGGPGAARWLPCSRMRRDDHGVLVPDEPAVAGVPDGPGVILVPGRAFDPTGQRVGRGGGWYDRLLALAGAPTIAIGVAYDCQRFDQLPAGPLDRSVAALVTESGSFRSGATREGREGNPMTGGEDR